VDAPRHGRHLTQHAPTTTRSVGIRAAGGLVALFLGACMPGVTVDPVAAAGPTLVLDMTNASSRERSVGYDFDGDGMSGTGEGLLGACARQVSPYGEVGGTYTIRVDGTSVLEGTVPPNGAGGYLVIRVTITADGEVGVGAPTLVRREPALLMNPIPGCG
jgi:hypothetical protein